jgi:hypothetical protein
MWPMILAGVLSVAIAVTCVFRSREPKQEEYWEDVEFDD